MTPFKLSTFERSVAGNYFVQQNNPALRCCGRSSRDNLSKATYIRPMSTMNAKSKASTPSSHKTSEATAAKQSAGGALSAVKKRAEVKRSREVSTPDGRLNEEPLRWLLGYQLAQASIVTISHFQEMAGNPNGLRTVEFTMLALIAANPGVSPLQLARALGLSPPYITTGLDKLCRRGLVLREASEKDGRKMHLLTTEQGEAMANELTEKLVDSERARFDTLSPTEQLMLAELLHKLARARPHPSTQGSIGPTKG